MEKIGDDCPRCPHPFDPHCVIPTSDSPLDGGIILCPVRGCLCFATWSTPHGKEVEDIVVPPMDTIELIREAIWEVRSEGRREATDRPAEERDGGE